jgi:flagellar basal-body rod protein FlgF
VTIGADGKVSQGSKQIGQVGVVDFADPTQLQRMEGGLFRSEDGAPTPVEKPTIASGFIEGSKVSPLRSMVDMIAVQRAYETNQKVISAHDQRIGQAIQILGNPSA